MARIKPLEALHYAPRLLEEAARLLSPPYDVIDGALRQELYGRSPWNAVRLELPCEEEPYAAAAERIVSWSADGVLERDGMPAYYVLQQEFTGPDGQRRLRTGFFAALRLSPPGEGAVLPHERTLSGPRADRLRLFRETRTNISPIFGIYADPLRQVDALLAGCLCASSPLVEAEFERVGHRMWRVTDPLVLEELGALLADRTVFIADGHHRYATGLDYRLERAAADPSHSGEEPWNYILAYLSNIHDDGLAIFPIHRLVFGLEGFEPDAFLAALSDEFEVVRFDAPEPIEAWLEASVSSCAYGVALAGRFYGALLKGDPEGLAGMPELPALRRLGLVVLHERIFRRLLGIDREAMAAQRNVRYLKDSRALFEAVAGGEGQIGFLVKPGTVRQVLDVAESGEVMPQKSTFFYPKVPTGLLFHPLD